MAQKLTQAINDLVDNLGLSALSTDKGTVRNELAPIILKYFQEFTERQASSIATVAAHLIHKDSGLARGELQSLTKKDLGLISLSLKEERIGQLFVAELALREGAIVSWNVNSKGVLIIRQIESKERLSTPTDSLKR